MTKQLLAGLLSLVMLFSLLPSAAIAATAAKASAAGSQTDQPESPYLNREDHCAYIVGSSDGLVHPEDNITRAEVATIFYRLLTDEVRSAYWTADNSFPDVNSGDWYNTAISTLANLGVINGAPDGGFYPNANITRAEFAAIAVRFFENTESCVWTQDAFSDIAGHWANESINLAYLLGIIHGDPDGSYRPGDAITRAEAMTIVNNTLGRFPSVESMEPVKADMVTWPDNMDQSKWYYAAVQEATNSHTYTLTEDGRELWQEILPNPDWTALEKEWAAAHSGETENGGNNTTPPVIPDPRPGGSTGTTLHDAATGTEVDFGSVALADMTVEPVTVAALEGKTYVAYDITPYYADGTKYTGSAQVTLPLTEELKASDLLCGFVVEDDGSITYIPGTRVGDSYTFTTTHFSTVGIVDNVVTLNVGGQPVTHEDKTGNYESTYTGAGLNTDIATVTVSGTDSTETTTYTPVSVTCNDLISSNSSSWKATSYYYRADDGNYYSLYAQRSGNKNYTYTWGYYIDNVATTIGTQTKVKDTSTTPNITVYTKGTTTTIGSTTITFTGVGSGTTTVTVGDTTYTINVYDQKTVTLAPKGIHTIHGAPGESPLPLDNTVAKAELGTNNKRLTITGKAEGQAKFTEGFIEYTVEVKENKETVTLKVGESKTYDSTATDITGADSNGDYEDNYVTATLSDGTSAVAAIAAFALDAATDTNTAAALSDDSSGTITFTGVAPGETTVTAGNTTYEVTVLADEADSGTTDTPTLKYFPVTLYNYDKTTINNATHQVEVDGDLGDTWNGIYFSDGSPSAEAYSEEVSIEDGVYLLQNARAAANNVGSWLVGNTSGITSTTNQSDATQWTIKSNGDGTYTLNSDTGYMTIGSGADGEMTAATASNIEIVGYTGDTYTGCLQLKSGSYYLCQWGGANVTVYGGYNVNNDGGNAFYLYKVTDSSTEKVTFVSTESLTYAAWNRWDKGQTNAYGQYTYSGLVESTLTAAKDITFTKPEGGIFNSDATVKEIYTNVEMPFIYENGTYTFDSTQNGAYFYADSAQGSTAAQSNGRLYFNEGNPQSNNGSYGDGSTTIWMPFNSTQSINGEANCDYHYGMRATIPFTMTANGKMNPNDNTSEDITFSFSGDDDIWIFVDGQLVIDLGGIHNRLDATINFAENTVTYGVSNKALASLGDAANMLFNADDGWTSETGTLTNANDESGTYTVKYTHKLFNDDDGTGIINQTRETFAATDSHEVTLFFLERGAGSSNCKIQFNLPAKDSVSVHKIVDKTGLSDSELEQVGNVNFNFILYKDGTPLANTTFSLLNANGQVISTPSTGSDGSFLLMDGQTAKFTGVIDHEKGNTYYVVENTTAGFYAPAFSYTADVAGDVTETAESNGWTSQTIKAIGSNDAEDHITFTCTNYLAIRQPPYAYPSQDWIVVDYGLPVLINPLHNDLWKGDSIQVVKVGGAPTYQTDENGVPITDDDGNKTITGCAENPAYGTVTINSDNTFTYQLDKQLSEVDVLTYHVKVTQEGEEPATAYGLVYIIPATSMYYEEDFPGLVIYGKGKSSSGWEQVGNPDNEYQETGYVRLTDTSPYGSDPAYLNDSGDSNGTSMHLSTKDGGAYFDYDFTGTGTSFFARTTNNTCYMKVVITNKATGTVVKTLYRDTRYQTDAENTALYNVPIFTEDGLPYGTYTVSVDFYKGGVYGSDFWLDGIRVINPLFDPGDSDYINSESFTAEEQIAQTAYAADGEANMTVATLRQKLLGDEAFEDEVPVYVPAYVQVDEDGNPVTDTDGNPVYVQVVDENGEPVTVTEGEAINVTDPGITVSVPTADADGKPVTDEDDNPISVSVQVRVLSADGTPVYLKQATGVVSVQQVDQDGQLVYKSVLKWNGEDAGNGFVIFTDSNGTITSAEEYRSNGPKEEVYLNNGQSVSFSLYDWDANTNKIYLGIKAPTGGGSVSINGHTLTISNTTDCYCDISGYATITTDEDGVQIATFTIEATSSLISVTNIKVTGETQFIIVNQVDQDVSGDEG